MSTILKYYGHSCFKLMSGNVSIVFDPYKDNSVPNLTLPVISANLVLVSHEHDDHNAREKVITLLSYVDIKYESFDIPHDNQGGKLRGKNKAHIVYLNNLKIVHLGDIGCMPDENAIEKLKDTDVLLAPINGFYTLGADKIKELSDIIKPKLLIPMHYYKDYNNSGYKDDNQFEQFKKLYPNVKIVRTDEIVIEDCLNENISEIAFY